jgi:hypothetical protein
VASEHTTAGLAWLLYHCETIRNAPKGTRGSTRNRHGFLIAQLVAGGELEQGSAYAALVDASEAQNDPAYREKDLRSNTFAKGLLQPRRCDDFNGAETADFNESENLSFEDYLAALERAGL